MAGTISGVFNTTGLGPAISSIGGDIAAASRQSDKQDWAREMELMKREWALNAERIKAEIRGAQGGGAGADARWNQQALTEEEQAAQAGMSVPEYRESAQYQRDKKLPMRPGFTVDDEGNPMTGPDGKSLAPEVTSYEDRPRLEAGAAKVREGVNVRLTGPKNLKERAEARTIDRTRDLTLDAPTVEAALEGGRRVGASTGKGEFKGGERTTTNEFTGTSASTPYGKAGEEADRAKATESKASADQKGRGEDEGSRKERRDIENSITQTEREIEDYNKNSSFMRKAKGDPNSQEAATLKRLTDRLDRLNSELRSIGQGSRKPSGKPASAASAARPKNQSEYNALPSGSLYVHPKDGKTYRKP